MSVVAVVLLLFVARNPLGPRWESAINNEHYVAYSEGNLVVLCAEGMTGPAWLNLLERMHLVSISDNNLNECLYVAFASAPAPGTYPLNGTGHLVISGSGAAKPFTAFTPSAIDTLWLERTCFCSDEDREAPFAGELIIDSLSPLRGRLKLDIPGPTKGVSIDASLASFDVEPMALLRRREDHRRRIRE